MRQYDNPYGFTILMALEDDLPFTRFSKFHLEDVDFNLTLQDWLDELDGIGLPPDEQSLIKWGLEEFSEKSPDFPIEKLLPILFEEKVFPSPDANFQNHELVPLLPFTGKANDQVSFTGTLSSQSLQI